MACSSLHVQSSPTGFQLIPQYVAAHCHCQGGQPVTFAPFVDDCVLEHQLIAVAPNLLPCPRVRQSVKRFNLRFAYETTPYSCNVFVKDLVTGVAVFATSDGSTVFFDHPLGKISFKAGQVDVNFSVWDGRKRFVELFEIFKMQMTWLVWRKLWWTIHQSIELAAPLTINVKGTIKIYLLLLLLSIGRFLKALFKFFSLQLN